ncbi:flagellin N-terminal helical domain-containing protein [Piscirickettsia litoralis]|uniref:Flagellin n=1 Tax=Piscirickettsia litoralis TaxID=1891921 RepID=A0ABX2ZYL4_9GAMM|nr:flagellin [Piscirickettsia litoralis]ODN41716.1 hypothetical protein BGC07_00345 [Piscirickettsia litoralis]
MVNPINNPAGLQSQQQLNESKSLLARSIERLTTGKRVNQAKDNPADFAIGLRLNVDISSTLQAIQNTNDASSVAQVASGGLEIQTDLLGRAQELALQAAGNPTLSDSDRALINNELQGVIEDFNDVAENTSFNGTSLLDGSFSGSFQLGASVSNGVSLSISSSLGAAVGSQTLSSDGSILNNDVSATGTSAIVANGVAAQNFTVLQNSGSENVAIAANASAAEVASSIDAVDGVTATAETSIQLSASSFSSSNISLSLGSGDSTGVGNAQTINATISDPSDLTNLANAINDTSDQTGVTASFVDGNTAAITLTNAAGDNIQISDIAGFNADLTSSAGTVTNLTEVGTDSALISGQVSISSDSATSFNIDSTSADIFAATNSTSSLANFDSIDASSQSGAQDALAIIGDALGQLTTSLTGLGAFQNSNERRVDQLDTSFQNSTAALGRKVDADFSQEVTEQIGRQIKFQVNAAILGIPGNASKSFLSLLNN